MPNAAHSMAEEAASRAEALGKAGDRDAARRAYLQAAEYELQAVTDIPRDKIRTRGILAVSVVSLFFKGADMVRAEKLAHSFLAESEFPVFARDQLRETLEAIWEEQTLKASGRVYTGETVTVSLRGGTDIGAGRAPLGVVADKIIGVHSLLYRITEWVGGSPFRTKGAPTESVRESCQAWVSEPQAGSYRFALRLIEPIQLELFPTRAAVRASDISDWLLRCVRAISPVAYLSPQHEAIEALIPDKHYRHAILKLVRNVVPDGHRIKEIEFISERLQLRQSALLHAGAKTSIERSLRADERATPNEEVAGVLRAVHLDRNWLEVVQQSGQPLRCKITHELLDDVVGPMLNRRVIVRGGMHKTKGFQLIDIELDDSENED